MSRLWSKRRGRTSSRGDEEETEMHDLSCSSPTTPEKEDMGISLNLDLSLSLSFPRPQSNDVSPLLSSMEASGKAGDSQICPFQSHLQNDLLRRDKSSTTHSPTSSAGSSSEESETSSKQKLKKKKKRVARS